MILRELKDRLLDWDLQDITDAAGLKGLHVEILIHDYDILDGGGNLLCKLSDGGWYFSNLINRSDSGPAEHVYLYRGFPTPSLENLLKSFSSEGLEELAPLIKEAEAVEKDLATLAPLWGQK